MPTRVKCFFFSTLACRPDLASILLFPQGGAVLSARESLHIPQEPPTIMSATFWILSTDFAPGFLGRLSWPAHQLRTIGVTSRWNGSRQRSLGWWVVISASETAVLQDGISTQAYSEFSQAALYSFVVCGSKSRK